MPTTVIGMFGTIGGGTEDSLAQIDIPDDGIIEGIDWDARADMDADSETLSSELSFIATNQLAVNDVRGRISSISAQMSLTTSGIAVVSIQKYVGPMDLPVQGGERLFVHALSTAGVSGQIRCNIHLAVGRSTPRRSQRR